MAWSEPEAHMLEPWAVITEILKLYVKKLCFLSSG